MPTASFQERSFVKQFEAARTPEQLATLMKADMVKWAKVIKVANIKLEEY